MNGNVITANFRGGRTTMTTPLWQYDYGQVLRFTGVSLPETYEVHFSNAKRRGDAKTAIGDANGVVIPDEFLATGDNVYAWIFLHATQEDGETEYMATIPVNKRATPSDEAPTPQEQSAITQAIAALNSAVVDVQEAVEAADDARASAASAGASATAAAASEAGVAEDADRASAAATAAESAQGAAEAAQAGAETAQTGAESARDEAAQASAAQIAQINATGAAVLDSIPADYTELSADVGNLKSDLNDISNVTTKVSDDNYILSKIAYDVNAYDSNRALTKTGKEILSGSVILSFPVTAGSVIKLDLKNRTDGDILFFFQDTKTVPWDNNTHIIGNIYSGSSFVGYLYVPSGATYLVTNADMSNIVSVVKSVDSSIVKDLKNTVDELEYVKWQLDNVFSEFEYGDIYISGHSGAYYDSSKRIRTKDRNGVYLEVGSTVEAVDVNSSVEFFIATKNGSNWSRTSWTKLFSIDTADYYYIVAHYTPESAISNLADIVSKIKISKPTSDHIRVSQCVADIDDLNGVVDYLELYSNYIPKVDLEFGDLFVDSSGVGTYYDSSKRIRTVRNNPMSLNVGDIVGMFDYSNVAYILYRKENNVYTSVSRNTVSGGSWAQQDTYIDTAGEYEVVIRYQTEATITSFAALADQFFVRHKYGVLGEITGIENTTDIYKQELETTVASVVSKTTSRALIFAVLTDTHVDRNRLGWYKQSMENLERLNNELHFNGIFHLGDIINGYYTAPLSKLYLKAAVDMMVRISPFNTYMVIGNHDNNNGAGDEERLTDTELYSIMHQYNEQYVVRTSPATSFKYGNPTSNYYFDYPSFKLRMVVFDSCYYGTGFSEDTITWMQATFNSAPNDYKFVLWTHVSTEAEMTGGNALGNAASFKALLAEYKNRIHVYIHGHSHYDYYGYVNEFAQVGLCCSVPDMPVKNILPGGVQPSRTINTVTQDCINIVILLPDENKLEVVRFGAGDDFTVPFRNS